MSHASNLEGWMRKLRELVLAAKLESQKSETNETRPAIHTNRRNDEDRHPKV